MIIPISQVPERPSTRVRSIVKVSSTVGVVLAAASFVLLFAFNVPTEPTPEDRQAIEILLADRGLHPVSTSAPREEQIRFIAGIQDAVLSAVAYGTGVGRSKSREPLDILRAGEGLCYDRSRFIEKALAAHGFTTRHAFLFKASDGGEVSWADLFKPTIGSHAVTEVKIGGEWMVIGSNTRWLSIDRSGRLWCLRDLERLETVRAIDWDKRFSLEHGEFWNYRFKSVYGLYSRHGEFFPPFNRVPDYNVRELAENFRR